jgi:hypothetical protein
MSKSAGEIGLEPNWVRVGWVEMSVDSETPACTISLAPSSTGVAAFGRGTIQWEDIYLGSVTLYRDCNGNGIPDLEDIANGTSKDCNGNGVPDECELASGDSNDCNGNGIPDECDITSGTSKDCNGNGIPDECDIASGDSNDCNGNGVPDECDITSGGSTDDNDDGIPDECQTDVRVVAVVTAIDPNFTSDARTTLPDSVALVVRGSAYYIEIWASDVGSLNTGITGVYIDVLAWEGPGGSTATGVQHGTIFTADPCETIIQGFLVGQFGGSAVPHGGGIDPEWVRVGWIRMMGTLEGAYPIDLQPASGGGNVSTLHGGVVPWSFVDLQSTEVEILAPARSYDLNGDNLIGVGDWGLFTPSWLQAVPPADERADFDCDGFVGVGDLSWFATGWLKSTSNPTILYPVCPGGGVASALGDERMNKDLGSVGISEASSDVAFEVVVLESASGSDTTTALPSSVEGIEDGETYYVEIWVSDIGDIDTGIVAAYVDLSFPEELSVVSISHGGVFTAVASGFNNGPGIIDELGGSALPHGGAIEPEWTRVAVVQIHADSEPASAFFALSASSTGVAAYGRGIIEWEDISLDSLSLTVGDLDGDGDVDWDDYAIFAMAWLTGPGDPGWNPDCDLALPTDYINELDLDVLCNNWLAGTGP